MKILVHFSYQKSDHENSLKRKKKKLKSVIVCCMDQSALVTYVNDLGKELKGKELISTIKSIKSCLLTSEPLSEPLQQQFQLLLLRILQLKLTPKITNALLPIVDPLFISNQVMRSFLSEIFKSFLPQPIQFVLNCCRIVFLTSKFQIENTYHCRAIRFIIDAHVLSSFHQLQPSQFYPLRLLRDYITSLIDTTTPPSLNVQFKHTSPTISPIFAPSPSPSILLNPASKQFSEFISPPFSAASFQRYCTTPGIQPTFFNQSTHFSRSQSSWNCFGQSCGELDQPEDSFKQNKQQAVLIELIQCASKNWFSQKCSTKNDYKKEYLILEQKYGKGDVKSREASMEMINVIISGCLPNVLDKTVRLLLIQMFTSTCFVKGTVSDLAIQIIISLISRHGAHMKSECRTIIKSYISETTNPKNSLVAIKSLVTLCSSTNALYSIYTSFDRDSLGSSVFKSIVICFLNGLKDNAIRKYCAQGITHCIRCFAPSPPLETHPSVLLSSGQMVERAIEEKCPSKGALVVGNYLHKDTTLDKNGVGYYLTRHEEALQGYLSILDLPRYDIYDALSISLNGFTLPSDCKSADQFVKTFSEIYHTSTSYSVETVKKLCALLLQFSVDSINSPIITNFQQLKFLATKMNIKIPTTDLMNIYDKLLENPLFPENKQIQIEDRIYMFHASFSSILSSLHLLYINELDPFPSTRAIFSFSALLEQKNEIGQLLSLICSWPLQTCVSQSYQSSSLKLLLQFCYSYGNSFGDAWQYPIRLFVHLMNVQTDKITSIPKHFRFNRYVPFKTFDLSNVTPRQPLSCPDDALLLAVFRANALSPSGLLSYIKQLLFVAFEMVNSPTPSITLLNMLLPVIQFNLHRLFYVFDSLKSVLFPMLSCISLHPQPRVASVALEILNSFYETTNQREELQYFSVTDSYYEILLMVISDSPVASVRQLVLSHIKKCSDWKHIFQILSTAAEDVEIKIVESAFDKLVELEKCEEEFFKDYFPYYINTLSQFSVSLSDRAANHSIDKLKSIACNVSDISELSIEVIGIWMSCIKALAKSMLNTNVGIATNVIQMLFEKLLANETITNEIKMRALQVIISSTLSINETSQDWLATIGTSIAFRSLENSKSYPSLLPDVVNLITLLIITTNDSLQKTGLFILSEIIPKLIEEPLLFSTHFTDLMEYFYDQITTSTLSTTSITPLFNEPPHPPMLSLCSCCNHSSPPDEMLYCSLCGIPLCSPQCLTVHSQQPHPFVIHPILRHVYVPKQVDLARSLQVLNEILLITNPQILHFSPDLIPVLFKQIRRYLSLILLPSSPKDKIQPILPILSSMCITLIINTKTFSPYLSKLFSLRNAQITKMTLNQLVHCPNPNVFLDNPETQMFLFDLIRTDDIEIRRDVKQLLTQLQHK